MPSTIIIGGSHPASVLPSSPDGDSISITNAEVTGNYNSGAGSDTIDGSFAKFTGSVSLSLGADSLSLRSSTLSLGVSAGGGNDSITLEGTGTVAGAVSSVRSINLGDSDAGGSDSLSLLYTTVGQSISSSGAAGAGKFSVTLNHSTVGSGASLTNTSGGSVQIANQSSVAGTLTTGSGNDIIDIDNKSSLQTVSLGAGDDNISVSGGSLGGSQVTLINAGDGANLVSVDNGSSVGTASTGAGADNVIVSGSVTGGTASASSVSLISTGAGNDNVKFDGSTLASQINVSDGDDVVSITNSTLEASSGNAVDLGTGSDQLTIRNSNANFPGDAADVNLGTGSKQVEVSNSTIGTFSDFNTVSLSIKVTNSTVEQISLDKGGSNQTISVSGSSIGTGAPGSRAFFTSTGNDSVTLDGRSTLSPGATDLSGGKDLFVIGTNTTLKTPNGTNDRISGGGGEVSGGEDTLRFYGTDGFTIRLQLPATVNNGSGGTVLTTVLTQDNYASAKSSNFQGQFEGTLQLGNDTNNTVVISEFEHLESVECFVGGTMIMTANGEQAAEALYVGDLVQTADAGPQPIRWMQRRHVTGLDMVLNPNLIPIRIRQGALGAGLPVRDLMVSPQHRILVGGKLVERMFGARQVLAPAKHLLDMDGVELARDVGSFDYVHFVLSDHHVVFAEGTPAETLYAGETAMRTLGDDACKELEAIFPGVSMPVSDFVMQPARKFINGRQTRKMVERMMKNGHSLLEEWDYCGLPVLVAAG